MSISKRFFGKAKEGKETSIYTLTNQKGMSAEILDFGGIIVSLRAFDKEGKIRDVVLGYDNIRDFEINPPFMGSIIGRCANRIAHGEFEIKGVTYKVQKNAGEHHIHGGTVGFDKVLWEGKVIHKDGQEALELTYKSADMEEGYPGNLEAKVTYVLTEEGALSIDYWAVSDKDTLINLTNHAYFNLSGHDSGEILDHKIKILSSKFTVSDQASIPTGEIREVAGTPMDLRELTPIRKGIHSDYDQIVFGKGYDHNWVLEGNNQIPVKAAEVVEEKSGIVMEVFTTSPGMQFYSGNYLGAAGIGKEGIKYESRHGFCLETQIPPDAIHHPNFPSSVFKAGQVFCHRTVYKFSTL